MFCQYYYCFWFLFIVKKNLVGFLIVQILVLVRIMIKNFGYVFRWNAHAIINDSDTYSVIAIAYADD